MRILYFDCFSGISGDMCLGAMLDLGIDIEVFRSELDKLNLAGYDIIIEKKVKNGIFGTDVNVILNEDLGEIEEKIRKAENLKQDEMTEHHHLHHHHDHKNAETSYDENKHKHTHTHKARNLRDIEDLIDMSDLSRKTKDLSKKVFMEIAKAEAKVHNKGIYDVHFHEVGAIDSIVDIVGSSICLELLGIDKVFASPLHDGHGFIECQHGLIPVPVPAVMQILAGSKIPVISEDINTELVTPTGAGIIKCLTEDYGNMPAMIIDRIGYGMGKRDTGGFNALRIVLGSQLEEDRLSEEISILETNIDDMSPEIIGFTTEKLFENGALDVFVTPIYMKKNRPAYMLTVLIRKELEEKLVDIILKETSTLGVRKTTASRYYMNREMISVATEYGDVRVKLASKGDIMKFAPEYEDCKSIANKTGMPISTVYSLVNVISSKDIAKRNRN